MYWCVMNAPARAICESVTGFVPDLQITPRKVFRKRIDYAFSISRDQHHKLN